MTEILYSFFTNNGFTIEIQVTAILFMVLYKHRKKFLLRIAVGYLFLLGVSLLLRLWMNESGVVEHGIRYGIMYAVVFLEILFCCRCTFLEATFCWVGVCALQHVSFRLYSIFLALSGQNYSTIQGALIVFFTSVASYTFVYFLLISKLKKNMGKYLENKTTLVFAFFLIIFALFFQGAVEYFVDMQTQPFLYSIISVYDILCCVFILWMEYDVFRQNKQESENALLEHMLHKQEEQYRISKENVEMINIKCHDIKHQISRFSDRIDSAALSELKSIIEIYDASIKTGNEVLDIFLAEKSLVCLRNDISFSCIADGKALLFMEPADVYALFGNALDNAIEAACKVEERARRAISMKVTKQLNLVVIHFENFYAGEIEFEDNLPVTTKENSKFHGYGMRSIRMIAEKYHGEVALDIEGGVFNLNIAIQAP